MTGRVVVVSGFGVVTALGDDPAEIDRRIAAGETGLTPAAGLAACLPLPGIGVCMFDVRPLLRRKKDRKLIPRAAELAIGAAHRAWLSAALGPDADRAEVGLFVGVGREPPDSGEVERALVRSARDGRLDPELLATLGAAAYPPLAPLRTLPNMVLAHVAIQLGFMGEAGTRAGDRAAGLMAVHEGVLAVSEGRAERVLAGGADSHVDPGSARDLVRLGLAGPGSGPGEGAAMLVLEPLEAVQARGHRPLVRIVGSGTAAVGEPPVAAPPHEPRLGWCGAADGVIDLVRRMGRAPSGRLDAVDAHGGSAFVAWG